MAYDELVFLNGNPPAINADNLNHMNNGIKNNDVKITALDESLKDITGNQVYSFTEKTCIVNNGTTTTLEQVSNVNADSVIIPCSEGDIFTITGEGLFNYRLWAFVGAQSNSSYPILSKADANAVANGLFLVAPANAAYLTVNAKRTYSNYKGSVASGKLVVDRLNVIEPELANLSDEVDDLADTLIISTHILIDKQPDSVESNTVYSTIRPNGMTLEDYQTDDFVVSSGEYYDITIVNLPSATQYKVAMFYDSNNNYIGFREREGSTNTQQNVFTRIPENATTMRISRSIYSTLSVKKYIPNTNSNKKRVSLNNGMIMITDNDYIFKMNKHGKNNLMDFHSVSKKDGTLIYQSTSDWQGPYEVSAVNNADGDAVEQGITFTGGNHAYSYDGTSGTPTARTSEFHVYADGVELNNGDDVIWTDNVKVTWTNFVQGWNTKKSDGTGREILKEMPTWIFNADGKVHTFNRIVALEDISIYMYYGLQMQASWMDNGVFIPYATRKITDMSVFKSVTSGGLGTRFNGYETIAYDNDVVIKMGFNPDVDLGDGNSINDASIRGTRIHATAGAGKLYIYMIFDTPLNDDEQMVYSGYYCFEKP